MIRPNYNEQVKNRINVADDGCIYIASDFADIADFDEMIAGLAELETEINS